MKWLKTKSTKRIENLELELKQTTKRLERLECDHYKTEFIHLVYRGNIERCVICGKTIKTFTDRKEMLNEKLNKIKKEIRSHEIRLKERSEEQKEN